MRLVQLQISDQQLSVKHLAESLSVHPNYLSSVFHDTAGMTLKAFITARRMRLARFLSLRRALQESADGLPAGSLSAAAMLPGLVQ